MPSADKGFKIFGSGAGGFALYGPVVGLTSYAQYETAELVPGDDGQWHAGGAGAPGASGAVVAAVAAAMQSAVVVGAAAGNITVSGLAAGSTLTAVIQMIGAGTAVTDVANLTSQFTVTAANTINNTGGTNTTGSKLMVIWI